MPGLTVFESRRACPATAGGDMFVEMSGISGVRVP